MSIKERLYETIDTLPEFMIIELLDYADYLASKNIEEGLPERVIVKDSEDLKKKLKNRIDTIKSGKAKFYSLEEVAQKLDRI